MKTMSLFVLFLCLGLAGFPQSTIVGKKAPAIEVENWIYPKIQVAGWRTGVVPPNWRGRRVVLDFWFTQCAPCVASIPELNQLAKQFPEILFLSISFDSSDVIQRFLDKMILYYPVGSDPQQKIIQAYGVTSFPETFFIDENGIIQWQGSPFQLNRMLIDQLLGKEQKMKKIQLNPAEKKSENCAYKFTLQENHSGMLQSSYYHANPYDIQVFNKDMEDMLKVFYGINKSRILTKDSALLKTTYDVTLKADRELTTHANCIEILKFLLPQQLKIELRAYSKDTLAGRIQIKNIAMLNGHLSKSPHPGTSFQSDQWVGKGLTIDQMKDFLEDNYSILLEFETTDVRKFDFVIPAKDLNKAKAMLAEEYGLAIDSIHGKIKFWRIIKR